MFETDFEFIIQKKEQEFYPFSLLTSFHFNSFVFFFSFFLSFCIATTFELTEKDIAWALLLFNQQEKIEEKKNLNELNGEKQTKHQQL